MPPATLDTLLTYDNLFAVVVTTAFAGCAWLLRGVTPGGALAGFAIALAMFVTIGPGGFVTLATVFAVALLSTRFGYRRKQALGKAEDARGRSAAQVLANLGAAGVFSVAAATTPQRELCSLLAVAALAEAAADTAASECGEALSDRAYLITSLREVRAGTDGGISLPGTLAAVAAAVIVGSAAAATHLVAWSMLPLVAGAGLAGTFVDSLLGATLERRGVVGNNGVNFASTFAAAVIVVLLWELRG